MECRRERERDVFCLFSAWEKPSGPLRAGPSVRRDCRASRRPNRGERVRGAPASNAMIVDRKRHLGHDEKLERTAGRGEPPGGSKSPMD